MSDVQSFGPVHEYVRDAWQRSILFLDILRQRANTNKQHNEEAAPNVLDFDVELVLDGRTLARPVNYGLVRVEPPKGTKLDPAKRPFVVVDPRAGHGPGIGGMKQHSEIGVALAAGHACYFIGFLPDPIAGQTTEDVWNAEAMFVDAVAARHPDAVGKPLVIANCQAGWQSFIMAATHPDTPGPLVLVGAPVSYWAGVRGKNPMRYLGGVLGGTWMTALAGDLGGGIFDGANLVANFESLDPAHTYVRKPYDVFAKVDTEAERFLDFETWWGSPVLLNATEMEWIAENLFVGNRLTSGEIRTSDGVQVDLRNVKSPIVVFCSWGDNITPPQQALGWITDLYRDDAELVASGQTIVYTLHQSVGHLGIFVSGKVADKEHRELASCMEMIDLMPPGLYEAVIEEVDEHTANLPLVDGRYLFSLLPRKLDDIRAFGTNSPEDDLRFAAAARVSEVNRHLYDRFARPLVRRSVNTASAELARQLHPNRLRFSIFSDENPVMAPIAAAAEAVRKNRTPAAPDNPLLAMEHAWASTAEAAWDFWGHARDAWTEQLFLSAYGSPTLQALLGLDSEHLVEQRRIERLAARKEADSRRRAELETKFESGGTLEASLRAVGHILQAEGRVDERTAAVLKALHRSQPPGSGRSFSALKVALREQSLLLRLDAERAISAIPKLLPRGAGDRRAALDAVRRMVTAQGGLSDEAARRLAHIESLFAVKDGDSAKAQEATDAGS